MRPKYFPPLLLVCLWIAAPATWAQTVDSTEEAFAVSQGGDVPPYVVPVLRLVSSTHVEPTTGLVLSESGLVLVPADFASAGDEIVVLDGGTDIVANGRTARIERNLPMDGLQVLSVYGLRRPAAPFADEAPADGDEIRLRAFPPAEQIAEGAAPLDRAATITVFGASADPALTGDAALPNVTGPLLDRCGNVVGFSVANDVQTLATSPGTRYRWRETLLRVLQDLGQRPAPSACREEPEAAAEPEQPAEEPAEAVEDSPVAEEAPPEPAIEEEEVPPEPDAPLPDLEILPPIEVDEPAEPTPAPGPEPTTSSAWYWLWAALALIAAGAGLRLWRRRLAGASDEPGADGAEDSGPNDNKTRADAPPPRLDSQVRLEGELADGTPLSISCPVSARAINLTIGRGQAADLRIPSPAVSRRHATVNGSAGELTFSDLGSGNGSSINGVPCLENEIMYLEPGDVLVLGDARFTLRIVPDSGEDE